MTRDTLSISMLARRAKSGYESTQKGRSGWLAGTFELATALSEARKKLPSDQEFHSWISKAGLASISKDDRAALICIGDYQNAARKYFASNEGSWSWRMCAQQVRFAVPVSQAAKPPSVPMRIAVHSVAQEPKRLYLKILNEVQRDAGRPPEPTDMSTTRLAEAARAVDAIIEASLLSIDSVARYCDHTAALPSPDRLREAARWLDLLADAMERTFMTTEGHA